MQANDFSGVGTGQWKHATFKYSSDVDIAMVYLIDNRSGLIAQTFSLDYDTAMIFMDVDDLDRAIALEFLDASTVLACCLGDNTPALGDEEHDLPLLVRSAYDASSDQLLVTLVPIDRVGQEEVTLEDGIVALLNANQRITAIRFARASQTVCPRPSVCNP